MGALQTIDDAIAAIRSARDTIHFIMMQWDPVIARWQAIVPEKSQPAERAIQPLHTGKSLLGAGLGTPPIPRRPT